jgi:hypothetical protein
MQHIRKIMNGLRARFGEVSLKDGQDMNAVMRSWERSLGAYAENDLVKVVQYWCDTAKYPRWPEVGEVLDMLKEWGLKPVQMTGDNRPPEVSRAEGESGVWYRWLLDQKSGHGLLTNSTILTEVLKRLYPDDAKPFSFLLTRSFMHGTLPAQWEERKAAFVQEYENKRELYKQAIEKYGAVRVNESKGEWVKW